MYDTDQYEYEFCEEFGVKKGNAILENFWEVARGDAEHKGYYAMSERVGELQEEGNGDVELFLCRIEFEFEKGINAGSVITNYDVCALGADKISQLKFKIYEAVHFLRGAWRSKAAHAKRYAGFQLKEG